MEVSNKKFLEIETKYYADEIDRLKFKELAMKLEPKKFLYVESTDVYYSKDDDFVRWRMAPASGGSKRSELTIKKKLISANNVVRTEVNLRVDQNEEDTIKAFCEALNYSKNFSIYKMCDIYYYDDADIVFYSVIDEQGKTSNFLEIEVDETLDITEEQAKEILVKYEKLLAPLGLSPQKRMKKSLWELYRKKT